MRPLEVLGMDPRLELIEDSVRTCLHEIEAFGQFPVPPGSIDLAFVDERECSRLHEAFFNDSEITDVMTFPGDAADDHAGDVAICPVVASIAIDETGLAFNEELTLYLVHAWLHLGGSEDETTLGKAHMRKAENLLMQHLKSRSAMLIAEWTG